MTNYLHQTRSKGRIEAHDVTSIYDVCTVRMGFTSVSGVSGWPKSASF